MKIIIRIAFFKITLVRKDIEQILRFSMPKATDSEINNILNTMEVLYAASNSR
jgi:hypothetical protein